MLEKQPALVGTRSLARVFVTDYRWILSKPVETSQRPQNFFLLNNIVIPTFPLSHNLVPSGRNIIITLVLLFSAERMYDDFRLQMLGSDLGQISVRERRVGLLVVSTPPTLASRLTQPDRCA